ncbi:hypothetical protein BCV70DRAFT_201143 [Testicularia cyperi]|uniref:Spindle pole body component n=1 Tax=Testicularia cyperi TaxID=1882483 RepID=A0A317XM28_9BASI|nr:hypothetical protein BCV70DRAFT_201143 [Testicularia cyperi]
MIQFTTLPPLAVAPLPSLDRLDLDLNLNQSDEPLLVSSTFLAGPISQSSISISSLVDPPSVRPLSPSQGPASNDLLERFAARGVPTSRPLSRHSPLGSRAASPTTHDAQRSRPTNGTPRPTASRDLDSDTDSHSSTSQGSSLLWNDAVIDMLPSRSPQLRAHSTGSTSRRVSDHTAFAFQSLYTAAQSADVTDALNEAPLLDQLQPHIGRHLAPVHPIEDVVHSLVQSASTGTSSQHFQWHQASASFVWAATYRHSQHVRASKVSLARYRKLQQRLSLDPTSHESPEPPEPVPLQPWVGEERIRGYSASSSDSLIHPFLEMAALLRRIDGRLGDIRSSSSPACLEAPAFAFALDTVLAWLKEELASWSGSHVNRPDANSICARSRCASILNVHAGLENVSLVLRTLGSLLSCGQPRQPPFRPLAWLGTTHACLSHLHSNLAASMASAGARLPCAVLAYLLDQTSTSWRTQVAKWIGYPGFESSRTGELDFDAFQLQGHGQSKEGRGAQIATPWSGAEIDWSLDERGEEDVGYTLRPSAVPSFLTFRSARDFLEAGRALRLLKRAAPRDHPLVQLWSIETTADHVESGTSKPHNRNLDLPTWLWTENLVQQQNQLASDHVSRLKHLVARWRRQRHRQTRARHLSHSSTASLGSSPLVTHHMLPEAVSTLVKETAAVPVTTSSKPVPGLAPGMILSHEPSIDQKFALLSQRFDAAPQKRPYGATQGISDSVNLSPGRADNDEKNIPHAGMHDAGDALATYLARAVESSHSDQPSTFQGMAFDAVTQRSLITPFQTWARLINASLISVFFQDLGLGTYLQTCKQFLLLGSEYFERQVVSSLFDVDRRSMLGIGPSGEARGGTSLSVVALNRGLMVDGIWPPSDALLSSALNTAVIETVSSMRQAHEESCSNRMRRYGDTAALRGGDGHEDAVTLAYKDLDERLSFAVVEPPSSSRKGKPSWADPSSIDALDWLTLSFHPPPLISPLLTSLAQTRYQRLWNQLLRIKRCKVAMRAAFQHTFKSTSASFTFDFQLNALLQRMRWQMGHFLDCYGGFVQEIGIEWQWKRFMDRLDRVRREVSDELGTTAGRSSPAAHKTSEDAGSDNDDDLEEDELQLDDEQRQALMTSSFELKDVFSLARYHERVLDRMLESTFLKSKQRGVAKIVNSLLQSILDFAQMCCDFHSPAAGTEPPTLHDFESVYKYFGSRLDVFLQALAILKDRSYPDAHSAATPGSAFDVLAANAGLSKRRRDMEAEKARLAEDELDDLRRLDADVRGKAVQQADNENVSSVEMLLARLNASGFYAEVDY